MKYEHHSATRPFHEEHSAHLDAVRFAGAAAVAQQAEVTPTYDQFED